jgi:hypothetical protein
LEVSKNCFYLCSDKQAACCFFPHQHKDTGKQRVSVFVPAKPADKTKGIFHQKNLRKMKTKNILFSLMAVAVISISLATLESMAVKSSPVIIININS